jgi:hypothetical protein
MCRKLDVTEKVEFDWNDNECLPLTKCVCGAEFKLWTFIISIYEDDPYYCPECKRGLFWTTRIKVYEVLEGTEDAKPNN